MLQHILIMALFALFMGGTQLILKARKTKEETKQPPHQQHEEEPIKKAV